MVYIIGFKRKSMGQPLLNGYVNGKILYKCWIFQRHSINGGYSMKNMPCFRPSCHVFLSWDLREAKTCGSKAMEAILLSWDEDKSRNNMSVYWAHWHQYPKKNIISNTADIWIYLINGCGDTCRFFLCWPWFVINKSRSNEPGTRWGYLRGAKSIFFARFGRDEIATVFEPFISPNMFEVVICMGLYIP